MYKPLGDRIRVIKRQATEDFKMQRGILLPQGHNDVGAAVKPIELLEVMAVGIGPACENINVGDMVIVTTVPDAALVYVEPRDDKKDLLVKHHIINAAIVIGRAYKKEEQAN